MSSQVPTTGAESTGPAKLGLGDVLGLSVRLAQFDSTAIDESRSPRVELWTGLTVVALAGGASGIFGGLGGIVAAATMGLISHLLIVGLLHLLAVGLGGRGDYAETVKVLGVGALVKAINVIPILGVVGTLWFAAIAVVVLARLYDISRERALIAVILPAVLLFILSVMFWATLISMFAFLAF